MVHHRSHTRTNVSKTPAAMTQQLPGQLTTSGHLFHTGPGPGVSQLTSGDQLCQCNTFLDPYPTGQSQQWRSMGTALQHYCRVCNTQLNSCKQARIHVAGKKHEKRLAYLKFSLETSEVVNNSYTAATAYQGAAVTNSSGVVQGGPIMSSALPTVYAYPPPCTGYQQTPAPTAYYFQPAASYPGQLGPAAGQLYHYEQQPPAPVPVPSSTSAPSMPPMSHYAPHPGTHSTCNNRRGKTAASGVSTAHAQSHGVMSPSLTSGFSGSGDCKSTETCSLLSVASYSSATPNAHNKDQGDNGGGTTVVTRHQVSCEVCHLPFPSRAVLEHHLMGSRHARKVKAESVLRELQENGAEFRATEATGDIRCEVCEVSVNSSHQLQAHMTGHKHKMRCARQGVAPNKTILTPASSTAPSTTPSEASAPVRSYSILVGRPQFGSRPNLYKTSATSRGGRPRLGAGHNNVDLLERHRTRVSTTINKLAKSRKTVRARVKTEAGSARQSRLVKNGDIARIGAGATDSTTESDDLNDAGTAGKKSGTKKPDAIVDVRDVIKNEDEHEAEESDEAKESEADQDSGKSGSGLSGTAPRYSSIVANSSNNVCQRAKASQTEPIRRLSVDACELISSSTNGQVAGEKQESGSGVNSKEIVTSKEMSKEPRRRSYSQTLTTNTTSSSNSNNNINTNNYHCNLCQISVNSQSQLAQHMNSNKHRRLSTALQSHLTGSQSMSTTGRSKTWYAGNGSNVQSSETGCKESLGQSAHAQTREIPMLTMFLQRLHQHHYFPPIRDEEDTTTETHR